MGEIQERLQGLENRRQSLAAAEARAAANAEHAKAALDSAVAQLEQLGFKSVEEAETWLQESSEEITNSIAALDKVLTEAGV